MNLRSTRGPSTIKVCKDCKYYLQDGYYFCTHATATEINNVVGYKDYELCVTMRAHSGPCGPEANLFEQRPIEKKKTLFDKIIEWFQIF